MSAPIRVVTTKAAGLTPEGAEYEYASTADADRMLGKNAYKILSHADGTPYQAPAAEKPKAEQPKGTNAQ